MTKRSIGYQVVRTWCRECASEGVRDFRSPMTEEDGPEWCDVCGEELKPCEHEWSEWHGFVWGGEFRVCDRDGCGESEYRDDEGRPCARPLMPALPPRPQTKPDGG